MGGGRIEILDIIRGYAIFVVVFGHVLLFSFHITTPSSYNNILGTINMPIFFFISGYILWKKDVTWNLKGGCRFLYRKFKVLVLAAIAFLCVYSCYSHFEFQQVLYSCTKMGYWFTIELFQYYALYVASHVLTDKWKKGFADVLLMALVCITFIISIKPWSIIPRVLYDALDMTFLRHFVFFYLGTLVRRNQLAFEKLIDHSDYMCGVLISFFVCIVLYTKYYIFPFSLLIDVFVSLLGILIVFAFFRRYESSFSQKTALGRSLQFVGRRTLDIYFLHYFFLPRNCAFIGEFFQTNSNPILEFAVCLCFSAMVIAICLLVSNIIRLSPFLAHVLLGTKK